MSQPNLDCSVAVILPAAGSGRRFGRSDNKLFALLNGQPLFLFTAERLSQHPNVDRIIMPVSAEDQPRMESEFGHALADLAVQLVRGGAERTDSVQAGLNAIVDEEPVDLVAVHDAARPLVSQEDLDHVFSKANECGAAILASPVTATVKQSFDSGRSCNSIDRSTLWLAQTPQAFRPQVLSDAYRKHRGKPATDDAELVARIGVDVAIVPGSPDNLKITHPKDLVVAEAILKAQTKHAPQ